MIRTEKERESRVFFLPFCRNNQSKFVRDIVLIQPLTNLRAHLHSKVTRGKERFIRTLSDR